MRFFSKLMKQNSVIVYFDSKNLVCVYFDKNKKNKKINLKAYKRYKLENLEIIDLTIFNSCAIQNNIYDFLQKNNLSSSNIQIILSGKQIQDSILKIVSIDQIKEKISQYKGDEFSYIYSEIAKNSDLIYYLAAIPNSLLFQYKLLAINSTIKISQIVPEGICLIKLAKLENNLLIDYYDDFLSKISKYLNNCEIDKYISLEKEINIEKEKIFLLKSLGLFLLKDEREKY